VAAEAMQLEILRSKTSMMDNLRQAARAFTPPSDRSHSAGHSGSGGVEHVLIVAETVHRLRIGVYLAFDEWQG